MRTIHQVRDRLLDTLRQAVQRPGLFGGTDFGVELVMQTLLRDLTFIDEREGDLKAAMDDLVARGQFSSMAVRGSFLQYVDSRNSYGDEVASVYAAVAHRLGYLTMGSTVPDADFGRMRLGLPVVCRDRDWTAGDVIARFGPPSLRVGWVFAYVPADGSRWLYFDFDGASAGELERDCLLRDVRIPADHFSLGLVFTPHGRSICPDRAGPETQRGLSRGPGGPGRGR
ncbi:hypothetical protein OJF2_06620 [Aquisphaera giovannonii]|uniref:Uncharacterized protein n=1 Tax=Aquisphaera giovannonii TaxID=406548 RepID=A0A5B9VUY1_9BACT|nr:hypothetical protein [Aquisphaera giovannonii]QEH32193.1 hypothetical protein OJF2_06620 [Aquisphaera giovannonii]